MKVENEDEKRHIVQEMGKINVSVRQTFTGMCFFKCSLCGKDFGVNVPQTQHDRDECFVSICKRVKKLEERLNEPKVHHEKDDRK